MPHKESQDIELSKVGKRQGQEWKVLVHTRFNVKIQYFNSIPES